VFRTPPHNCIFLKPRHSLELVLEPQFIQVFHTSAGDSLSSGDSRSSRLAIRKFLFCDPHYLARVK